MNSTTKAIIDLLPRKPLLSPDELSAAYGLASSNKILADIKTGVLAANKVGSRYIISRAAAEAYILANEFVPEEGTI